MFSRVRLLATPWTSVYQAPPPMGSSRQEYWSGVPLPSPKPTIRSDQISHSVVSDSLRPHESHQISKLTFPTFSNPSGLESIRIKFVNFLGHKGPHYPDAPKHQKLEPWVNISQGNGNPLQYFCLGNPMDRGAWQPTVLGVARVQHDLATKQQ